MKPKISVIIPVYKAEKYISKCLHSLFNQSLTETEFIFVDDSSPDNSVAIIKETLNLYPHLIPHVHILQHDRNCGVSKSRQDGLQLAAGEYVIHCDPDDWIDTNFLEELYTRAIHDNADVVFCDFSYDNANYSKRISQKPKNFNSNSILCHLFINLHGSTWNKLIRTSKIKELDLEFDPRFNFCEDLLFNVKLFLNPLRISYTDKTQYHYNYSINPNSVVRKYSKESYEKDKELGLEIQKLIKNTPASTIGSNYMSFLIAWRSFIGNCFTNQEYKDNILPYWRGILRSYSSLSQKFLLLGSVLGFYRSLYHLYNKIKSYKK